MRITLNDAHGIPRDLRIGDKVNWRMEGRVVSLSAEMVDVSTVDKMDCLPGELSVEIIIAGATPVKAAAE